MHIRSYLYIVPIFLCLSAVSAQAATYYIATNGSDTNPGTESAPFRTIQKARDVVRSVNASMTADINVHLRGGIYFLSQTFVLNQLDSGTNGYSVTYQSYPGERAVISGGSLITGWTAVGNGVYKAAVGSLRFRQLYVSEGRAIRARDPIEGSYYRTRRWDDTNRTIIINSANIANWSQLNKVELVQQHNWDQNRYRISSFSISGPDAIVTPQEPERTLELIMPASMRCCNQAYHFENAYEFLDQPGEWYLNEATNELFYKPRTGENMNTAIAIAPVLERIVQVQGTLDDFVHHIRFKGINFEHSNWLMPGNEGFVEHQADNIFKAGPSVARMPAGLHLQNARNIVFEGNVLKFMGSTALGLHSGTSNNLILGNAFGDIAGGGISIDLNRMANPSDVRVVNSGDIVENNYVTRVGLDYKGSVGILVGYADGATVEHNEVDNVPYSGISAGWGWATDTTQSKNIMIRYNRVHRAMNLMDDGAAIYTLSKQAGSQIFENYLYDIAPSSWAVNPDNLYGIYLDQGSSLITVKNNAVEIVTPYGLFLHYACDNTVVNWSGTTENYGCSGNTFTTDSSFNPAAVKANAGLEAGYANVPQLLDYKYFLDNTASTPTPTPSPTAVPGTSPDRACVPTSSSITDGTGAVWTLGTGSPYPPILRNGIQASGAYGSKIMLYQNTIYIIGDDPVTTWYRWTGTGWTQYGTTAPNTCLTLTPTPLPSSCSNPSPIPSGFSTPCPVFGIAPTSGSLSQNFTVSLNPPTVGTVWIYKTMYITEGSTWKSITLPGTIQYTYWLQGNVTFNFQPSTLNLTPGSHFLASWDWTWDAANQCYKGPGATTCGGGQYRIQQISVQ